MSVKIKAVNLRGTALFFSFSAMGLAGFGAYLNYVRNGASPELFDVSAFSTLFLIGFAWALFLITARLNMAVECTKDEMVVRGRFSKKRIPWNEVSKVMEVAVEHHDHRANTVTIEFFILHLKTQSGRNIKINSRYYDSKDYLKVRSFIIEKGFEITQPETHVPGVKKEESENPRELIDKMITSLMRQDSGLVDLNAEQKEHWAQISKEAEITSVQFSCLSDKTVLQQLDEASIILPNGFRIQAKPSEEITLIEDEQINIRKLKIFIQELFSNHYGKEDHYLLFGKARF